METFGKKITVYLADGTPTGIRHAELANWTGQAIVCPRGKIAELVEWKQSKSPGVYFLIGEDGKESRPAVYIGEAENVLDRLQYHLRGKDFWNHVVFFTNKDENLTKAHVKYLEARLVTLATKAERARIENGTEPQLASLPRADRDAMEEFLKNIPLLLGCLGFSILQSLSSKQIVTERTQDLTTIKLYFRVSKRPINATGSITDEGFVVYENSRGDKIAKESLGKGYRTYREQLLSEGALVADSDSVRFTRNVFFTSPSAAAAVIAGGAYNGREAWKDEQGIMLKTLEEQLASLLITESGDTITTESGNPFALEH